MFTYNLGTASGKLRLIISDTSSDNYDFEDDEIAAAISLTSDVYAAGAMLLRSLAANRSKLAVSVKRGNVSEDLTKVAQNLLETAKSLDLQSDNQSEDSILVEIVSPDEEFFSWKRNRLLNR